MEAYLQYLENVLGIKQVIWPEVEAVEAASEEDSLDRVHVLFLAEKAFSKQAGELFEKMRDAMKIPNNQYRVLFASETKPAELEIAVLAAEHVVYFSKSLFDEVGKDHPAKFLTHSPEALVSKPALKKEAWEDLKKVMKSLGVL